MGLVGCLIQSNPWKLMAIGRLRKWTLVLNMQRCARPELWCITSGGATRQAQSETAGTSIWTCSPATSEERIRVSRSGTDFSFPSTLCLWEELLHLPTGLGNAVASLIGREWEESISVDWGLSERDHRDPVKFPNSAPIMMSPVHQQGGLGLLL